MSEITKESNINRGMKETFCNLQVSAQLSFNHVITQLCLKTTSNHEVNIVAVSRMSAQPDE